MSEILDDVEDVNEILGDDEVRDEDTIKSHLADVIETAVELSTELAVAKKRRRKKEVVQEEISDDELLIKIPKAKEKVAKQRKPKDIRTMFRMKLQEINVEKIKKPWMAEKVLRRVHTKEELKAWVDKVLRDTSLRHLTPSGEMLPVVACDTETIGLDTRILIDLVEVREYATGQKTWMPIYETKMEIAGVCLSADGIEGIYVPINHEDGFNIPREEAAPILQYLFDNCHLAFYHAKFDREVMRQTMGINFRGYPYFEDVQVLNYLIDPKADLGDSKKGQYTGDTGGLKALSLTKLGIDQIELDEIGKVTADYFNPDTGKTTQRIQYVPFTWIPTDIAYWYAAGDAICTWLLWKQLNEEARALKLVHRIDHELVDTLTWLERQRYIVDVDRHRRTVQWHQKKLSTDREELRQDALKAGYVEEEGQEQFNPDSPRQLGKLLFEIMGLKVLRRSKKTNEPSCDAEVISDLTKMYPSNDFLRKYAKYKEYVALHPENLKYDPKDHTARIYLKACVVAGGRLSASGGKFELDGGFGLNIQGIKRVEGNWWVKGKVLEPDTVDPNDVEEHNEQELDPSCFKMIEKTTKVKVGEATVNDLDGKPMMDNFGKPIMNPVYETRKEEVRTKAPNIIKNHIGQYLGYAICLVPGCETCAKKYGILIEKGRMDANEVINLRAMFMAPKGWTFATIDYSNIEMRVAANISGEPEFIKEFLEGTGDFHSLTASKVFPEFNDPHTDKATKKALRALAKILNFALLYGGTAYTIFENMKKKDPNMTFERAQAMVDAYWAGVPVFAEYCARKQAIAKEKMICTTATGRIVKFDSAMKALGIHPPTKEEMENYWDFRRLEKAAEAAKRNKKDEEYKDYRSRADALWKNPESGVRNAGDYNQFMGKIQRVSVNVPMQGLAGDFMRITLNRIRIWATEKDPLVQSVLLMHGSVHDEIDFSFKNEYAPFLMPRLTRLMKLRKYHKKMGWRVPIECDAEYGPTWDVVHHMTGDDGHKPAGWTEIPGMENYVPEDFDKDTVVALLKALRSGDDTKREKVKVWLKENLHQRTHEMHKHIFEAKDPKDIKKFLFVAMQLHEYWTIDEIPDEDESKMETLEQYEARCGLTAADRGQFVPSFGFLGAIPLEAKDDEKGEHPYKVVRPELLHLGEGDVMLITTNIPEPAQQGDLFTPDPFQCALCEGDVRTCGCDLEKEKPSPEAQETTKRLMDSVLKANVPEEKFERDNEDPKEEDLFLDIKPKATPAPQLPEPKPEPKVEKPKPQHPILKDLTASSAKRLREALGIGTKKVRVIYQGTPVTFTDVAVTTIPEEFLVSE